MADTKNKSGSPRFQVGDKVRVKPGVIDPDFPDIPLGGWSGTVTEVEQADDQITYEIKWDKRTLNGMHPVYRKRCERDGLELETMWLGEEDIEPDDGTPVPIEQPTADQDAAAVGEGPGRSGPHGPRADPRRPAPRCQPEDPAGLLPLPGGEPEVPVQGKDRKRRHVADRSPTDRPQGMGAGRRGRAALRSSGSSGAFYRPAIGTRRRRGEPQTCRGLWLLVLELAIEAE